MNDLLQAANFGDDERLAIAALCDGPCTAEGLAARLGLKHFIQANRILGNAGRKLYEIAPTGSPVRRWRPKSWKASWFYVIAPMHTSTVDGKNYWQVRPPIKEAMEALGWHTPTALGDSSLHYVGMAPRYEGAEIFVTVSVRERDRYLRAACIQVHGCRCVVCGFDFEEAYGELGRGFTHVHHLKPLAARAKESHTDPRFDLIPVCANCHAMIHRGGENRHPDELRLTLKRPNKALTAAAKT